MRIVNGNEGDTRTRMIALYCLETFELCADTKPIKSSHADGVVFIFSHLYCSSNLTQWMCDRADSHFTIHNLATLAGFLLLFGVTQTLSLNFQQQYSNNFRIHRSAPHIERADVERAMRGVTGDSEKKRCRWAYTLASCVCVYASSMTE